jgi:plastocyanin
MRRRVLVPAAVAAAALGALAPAQAQMMGHGDHGAAAPNGPRVSIQYASFVAPKLDVVAGDTVRWANDSARPHDVAALDQSFDSGRIVVGDSFTRTFDEAGTVQYLCSLHPSMTGEIDVHSLLLDTPSARGGSNKPFVLSGRAAAGRTGSVTIEGDDGAGFRPAGSAAIAPDGTFRATVVPRTTTTYRAVSGAEQSPPVPLSVLDHTVAVTAARRGATTTLTVRVAPAAPGEPVVLQLRLRDRFGWWPVGRARLDHHSMARFVVRRRAAAPARVLLTLPDEATELARSRTLSAGLFVGR